jgi:diguanylate cyclase (GGDEF)-like protein
VLVLGVCGRRWLVARRRERTALASEQRLARTDHLTGAANRRALDEEIRHAVNRARSGGPHAALVVFDVDHFKRINADYGWDGGDAVLHGLVARVRETVRRSDLVARRGGEEFAIVAAGVEDLVALRRTTSKVHAIVRAARFEAGPARVPVTVSVGATLIDGTASADEVERRANRALAAAKRQRDCVVVWDVTATRHAA